MDLRFPALAWAAALTLATGVPAAAAEPDTVQEDEQALKAAHLGADGPALLDFFRKRTPVEADRHRIEALITVRRAAAVAALLRSGSAEQRRPLRKYLQDPDPHVRLEAGLALVDARDRDAVPVLIALITELPQERCWPIEDVLCRLAGEQTPSV